MGFFYNQTTKRKEGGRPPKKAKGQGARRKGESFFFFSSLVSSFIFSLLGLLFWEKMLVVLLLRLLLSFCHQLEKGPSSSSTKAHKTPPLSLSPSPSPSPSPSLSLSLSLSLSGDDERRAPRRGTPILPIPRSLVERRQTPKPPMRRPRQSESVFGEVDVLVGKKSGCSRGRWHRDDRKLERRWGGYCRAGEV